MDKKTFEDLNLKESILKAIKDLGYEEPSQIQSESIPIAIEGYDLIGQAQTGTGKTAAFGCSILNNIDKSNNISSIILTPTRELAMQIYEELNKLSKYEKTRVVAVYGGDPIQRQIRDLKRGTDIVVGTPGRVLDLIRRNVLPLSHIQCFVLDEADEMLNMGFIDIVTDIIKRLKKHRNTMLFSATIPEEISGLCSSYMNNPVSIEIKSQKLITDNIEHKLYNVKEVFKIDDLNNILMSEMPETVVIFCKTKENVDRVFDDLKRKRYSVNKIHGGMLQKDRLSVMDSFKKGDFRILVATDVAARGIDVDDVEAVFNYDLPQDEEYYVHRIGRTGRAGRTGISFTFVFGKEMRKMKDIERYTKSKLEKHAIPSIADVEEKKVSSFFQEVKSTIEEGHLTKQIQWLENFCKEEDYDTLDIAAALVKLALGEENKEEIIEEPSYTGAEAGMVRLFINIGRKQKVQARDIVGAIAGEVGIPGKLVGTIDIYDKYTFVEVPKNTAKKVLDKMKNIKIKGNKINIERANTKKRSK